MDKNNRSIAGCRCICKQNILSRVIILLILMSCFSFMSCSGTTGEKHVLDLEFHTGTKGVEMDMFGLLPEVYEKTAFKISLSVFNHGAYDLPSSSGGFVNLNLEGDYMCLTNDGTTCLSDKAYHVKPIDGDDGILNGKSIINPTGDLNIIEYYLLAREIDSQSFSHDANIAATVCYKYQTDLVTEICLDPFFYDLTVTEKPCEVKDLSFSGQGAPLAITKIEQKMLSAGQNLVRPMFVITVENRGNGNIINKDMVQQVCSADPLTSNTFNIVHLRRIEFSNGKTNYFYDIANHEASNIECDFSNKAETKVKNNKAEIRCVVKDTPQLYVGKESGTFSTQMRLIFDYGYTFTESRKIAIKNLETY